MERFAGLCLTCLGVRHLLQLRESRTTSGEIAQTVMLRHHSGDGKGVRSMVFVDPEDVPQAASQDHHHSGRTGPWSLVLSQKVVDARATSPDSIGIQYLSPM